MKFNNIIRAAMKRTGVTQKHLGERLGVFQGFISNTLHRPEITLSMFVSMMNALGYEVIVCKIGDEMTLTNE